MSDKTGEKVMLVIGIIIVIGLVIYLIKELFGFNFFTPFTKQQFRTFDTGGDIAKIDQIATTGIERHLVDTVPCSPDCCGNPQQNYFDTTFDGLTINEIQQKLATASPYDPPCYTCANGQNGVGCPCLNPGTATFIGNRGDNA